MRSDKSTFKKEFEWPPFLNRCSVSVGRKTSNISIWFRERTVWLFGNSWMGRSWNAAHAKICWKRDVGCSGSIASLASGTKKRLTWNRRPHRASRAAVPSACICGNPSAYRTVETIPSSVSRQIIDRFFMGIPKEVKQTPMMQQFFRIKQRHADAILFYRMGDFYEMFGEDAVTASKILQIQLTTRNKNREDSVPMCGVPYHAYEQYLNKLSSAGHKVAICEQVEDPALAQGIVKREVVRIVTPGTVVAADLVAADSNSFICGIASDRRMRNVGIAFADLSTGEFELSELEIETDWGQLLELVLLYRPPEILIPSAENKRDRTLYEKLADRLKRIRTSQGQQPHIEFLDSYVFDLKTGRRLLQEHFAVGSLAGFGIAGMPNGISAAGAVLRYLKDTQKDALHHLASIKPIRNRERMLLDEATVRNLELFQNSSGFGERNTLFSLMNRTKTAMGARMLRRWLAAPLIRKAEIDRRLDYVESFVAQNDLCEKIRELLRKVGDLERIISRISLPLANIADVVRLRTGLQPLPYLAERFRQAKGANLPKLFEGFDELHDLYELLIAQLAESPKLKVGEGGYINSGVDEELDRLRDTMKNGKQLIANMEAEERQKQGINSLKIGYNRVFGYFIEISNTFKHAVPEHYVRKQTLVNCERYVTEDLKELEESILSAEDRTKSLEIALFENIKKRLRGEIGRIQRTAALIAEIDVYCTFAHNAGARNYCRPQLSDNPNRRTVEIAESRHPVIESLDFETPFVPNDTHLDSQGEFILIITGPNMGGKSTYMRQTALIALMAQIGSFVPARKAQLSVFDRIFTRTGAADNLTRGQSTFMVEMSEAASILNNATAQSLIILDEIGRGTSTFDGISIAWAMIENIHKMGALTLFATHYHELILLEEQLKGVANAKVVVKEENEDITFLRKVVAGKADKSYGIQVARLAGLPQSVVDAAQDVLAKLEAAEEKFKNAEQTRSAAEGLSCEADNNGQLSFMPAEEPWVAEIKKFDINRKTPFQAMEFLYKIQRQITGK